MKNKMLNRSLFFGITYIILMSSLFYKKGEGREGGREEKGERKEERRKRKDRNEMEKEGK